MIAVLVIDVIDEVDSEVPVKLRFIVKISIVMMMIFYVR